MKIILINLETLDIIETDAGRLRDLGIPDGYEMAEHVSTETWIKLLREARGLEDA